MSFYTYDFKKLPPSSGGHHPKGVGVTGGSRYSGGGHESTAVSSQRQTDGHRHPQSFSFLRLTRHTHSPSVAGLSHLRLIF